jgi:cytochrome c oxidase cbb3-type subunit III
MYAYKKIVINILGYLILIINTVAANHLVATSEVSLGKKIYHDRCEVCHGNQGDGKTFAANALYPTPKNFTAKVTKKELTRERMIKSITRGRPGTAMMPWERILSKQEIHSVVNYIQKVLMGL